MEYRFPILLMFVGMLLGAFNVFSWISLYIISFALLIASYFIILKSKKKKHNYRGVWSLVKGEYDTLIIFTALFLIVAQNLMPEPIKSIIGYGGMVSILFVIGFCKKDRRAI
ncbi:hypothetical protein WKH56_09295 [Priestia sp. SB1]|uniref:Uncharacterized protein n=1 Tax=Priestia aryabhattai TaxID=412384 RepID=A0AAX6ND87_PRIAR|nr:hypothetical protein [Priestia aryabhattai]MDU9693858.1 hypothetical protein [Priestia aryabhattai]NGY88853.1 hypothetical protein [Priestia megaterium]